MKTSIFLKTVGMSAALILAGGPSGQAQGVADPLNMFGLDRFVMPDARVRAMGWAGAGAAIGTAGLYTNPALLAGLEAAEIRLGGLSTSTAREQRQEWYPDKVYATLSLVFENRIDGIVDTSLRPLEHAYDNIQPNWKKNSSAMRPASGVAAIPIDLGGVTVVAAAGYSETVNLDHYFQNNNALSPYVGAYRPAPMVRPALGETVKVAWYQFSRERTGSIYGITPGAAVKIGDNFSFGFAATVLTGTSDDEERTVGRGRLRLTTSPTGSFNVYYIDSVRYLATTAGTSTYSGVLGNIGAAFRNQNFSAGLSLRIPGTVTRKWDDATSIDTMGTLSSSTRSGEDKLIFPLSYTVGLAFFPKGGWTVAVDYVVNNLDKAKYTPSGGIESKPWLGAKFFRVGAEYMANENVRLRAGYREDARVFAGEGAAIMNDPIRGSVYSFGAGLSVWVFDVSLAYEYETMAYHDAWTSNVNFNESTSHALIVDVGMRF